MSKYPIKKEFFPFNHFKPPIRRGVLRLVEVFMKALRAIYRDKALKTVRYKIESYDGEKIECFLFSPKGIGENAPCLIYIHGGGFVLPAAGYHYKNAMRYAKGAGCKVWFINYRLAPRHAPPVLFEDCYAAVCYLYENAENFGVNRDKIGIGGDSAGATLSVGVCMMAKDREHPIKFIFQMLPYPFLDMRRESESNKKYTDTPMWNARLSKRVDTLVKVDKNDPTYVYYSPVEAESFAELPPAYIETTEFDCLHDDGILYAELLTKAGILVTLNETKGTMHAFDIKQSAPTSKEAVETRIAFMKGQFFGEEQ